MGLLFVVSLIPWTHAEGQNCCGSQSPAIRFLYQTTVAAPGGMTPRLQQLQTSMMALAASHGDLAGMEAARRTVWQMAHESSLRGLQDAYRSLVIGDGVTASQQLAGAHAFFPDGSVGQFGLDESGGVWGRAVLMSNPAQATGRPFSVTAGMVLDLLRAE